MASVLVLVALLLPSADAFRVINSTSDALIGTHAVFEPYAASYTGYYGEASNLSTERLIEASMYSLDTPRIFFSAPLQQSCPGMVGPGHNGEFYCFSREYGYCDQQSGLCICNQYYTGLDCTACQSGYFQQGGLCYAKNICPNDCSRGGKCDYATGTCSCDATRRGVDCSQRFCSFDENCVSCTSTKCLKCAEKFYVDQATQTCVSCGRYDPRCLSCDSHGCQTCADLLINSVRRSGQRRIDEPLPEDERLREFSQTFVYGSQDPRVFDEAESYVLAPPSYTLLPLNESSVACTQGDNADSEWTCTFSPESHRVCGHRGVFSFESPLYAIDENAGNITVTVKRSGGGLGRATLLYDIEHVTTTPGNVSPTMFYTSSQRLDFAPGVTSLAIKIQIHDNHVLDYNNSFKLQLREPFAPTDVPSLAPATLGNQWRTLVTIVDNDRLRPLATLSHVTNAVTTLLTGGIAGELMSFQIYSVLGSGVPGPDPFNEAVFLVTSYVDEDDSTLEAVVSRPPKHGTVVQSEGMDKSLFTCTWMREHAGNFSVAIQLLYPGGLRGEYYGDAWLGETFDSCSDATSVVSRIDRHVNFTWNTGPAFPGAQSHFSVRWSGWLKPLDTGTTILAVSVVGYARLWVDDVLVIDRWGAGGDTSHELPLTMAMAETALDIAELHALVLEYRAPRQGSLHAQLLWKRVESEGIEVIPAKQLYSGSHLRDSPFTNVVVSPALTASAELSTTSLTIDESSMSSALCVIAGNTFAFNIFPRDAFGNRRRSRDQYDLQHDVVTATLTLATDRSLGGQGTQTENALVTWIGRLDVFRVVLLPQRSGDYFLSVDINGVALAASPFTVSVEPAQLTAQNCVLSGSGLLTGRIAGQTAIVMLETRDLYSNRIFKGGLSDLNLQASHLASSAPIVVTGQVVDNADGTYKILYTPRVVGSYSVSVTWKGVHLHNSPYAITVVPNLPVGSTSSAQGPGIMSAKTNVQTSFDVITRDSSYNNLPSGGVASALEVELELVGKSNVSGNACTDLLNGHYTCAYTAQHVGLTRLFVSLSNQAINGSPFLVNVTAGPAMGSRCVASGEALVSAVAGRRTNFTITIYDTFGNAKSDAGSESIDVKFTGPDAILTTVDAAVTVTYIDEGIYHVIYTLNTKGSYQISVSVDSESIVSSPFTMYVYPDVASPAKTSLDLLYPIFPMTLVDPPLVFRAGALIVSRLTTRDSFGNVLETGGNLFELDDAVGAFLDAPITDEKNGSYLVTLRPKRSLIFPLFPKLMVPGGVNSTYFSASTVPAGSATADSSSDHSLLILERQGATIDFDFGEKPPMQTYSANTFSVRWNGYVLPLFSEIYTVELNVLGSASLRIGSTYVAVQEGGTRASKNISFTAQIFMRIELNFSKPEHLANSGVSLWWSSLSQSREIIPSDQLFTSWKIINNVPLLDIKPAAADPNTFTPEFSFSALISESAAMQAVADDSFVFTVVARDSFSNRLEDDADCTLYVVLPQVLNEFDLSITKSSQSSYNVDLVLHLTGTFSLYVAALPNAMKENAPPGGDALVAFLAPFNIKGGPFEIHVDPGPPNAVTSTLIGGGFVSTTAGVLSNFVLELRDSSENRLTASMVTSCIDKVRIKLRVLTTGAEVFAKVYQEGQSVLSASRIQVEYTATHAGLHAVLLSVDEGKFYEQKTATLISYPNVATADESVVSLVVAGATATNTVSGPQIVTKQYNTYHVTVRDAFGNIRAGGGDHLNARINGPENSIGNITDLGNGDYIVTYRAMLPGAYEIETLVAGPQRGLTGYYYANTRSLQQNDATAVRSVDAVIDFAWNKNISMRGYPRIVWRGFLRPSFTEEYAMWVHVPSDMGSAAGIYIDDEIVIDGLNTGAISGRVTLISNRLHAIVVEYRGPSLQQNPGHLSLFWQSARQPSQLIPTESLIAGASEILPRTQLVAVN